MQNLKLVIEYVGTAYHGWQVQPGVPTVQGVLQDRLSMLAREAVLVRGAARTDAGVHAMGQVASARLEGQADPGRLQRSLNALLPDDIRVRSLEEVPEGFHARHSARGRIYRYQIVQGEPLSPFVRQFAAHSRHPLDTKAMADAAAMLLGRRDFSSFKAAGDVSESPVKEIRGSTIEVAGDSGGLIIYTVEASSFLQHMVRTIAGTLIEVGRGRFSPSEIKGMLESLDRRNAGPTAPARGLCLMKVLYPDLAPSTRGC